MRRAPHWAPPFSPATPSLSPLNALSKPPASTSSSPTRRWTPPSAFATCRQALAAVSRWISGHGPGLTPRGLPTRCSTRLPPGRASSRQTFSWHPGGATPCPEAPSGRPACGPTTVVPCALLLSFVWAATRLSSNTPLTWSSTRTARTGRARVTASAASTCLFGGSRCWRATRACALGTRRRTGSRPTLETTSSFRWTPRRRSPPSATTSAASCLRTASWWCA